MTRSTISAFPCAPIALLTIGMTMATACSGPDSPESTTDTTRQVVQAVNYPLAYFAERIAGDSIEVGFLPPADVDPAFWKPTAPDITTLQAADRILQNGATYAKWMPQVSLSDSRLVYTSRDFADAFIRVENAVTHSHGEEGEHSHAGTAFTTWIDLRQAGLQATAVRDALIELAPEHRARFETNANSLAADLQTLDAAIEAAAKRIGSQPLLASHPVYQYFARRYDLNIKAVHWEPETVPDDAALAELDGIRKDHQAKWMIWEGEPAKASVDKLATRGIRSIVFAPCGNRPPSGDWLGAMRTNVENLATVGQ